MNRREFLYFLNILGLPSTLASCLTSIPDTLYPADDFGNVTLLHITDCHAQLLPVYYREPENSAGFTGVSKHPLYLTGQDFLNFFGIKLGTKEAYAFTHLNFAHLAEIFGKMGGFAQLAALIKQIKTNTSHGNFLLLDGGDSWQGSATSLWTQGRDMIAACNLLGVDVMTGHWEFTYGAGQVIDNQKQFNGEFIAQNISLSEEAQFASAAEANSVFQPFVIKEFGNARIAVIGQAYPYTPIANPKHLIPDWRFGIEEGQLQSLVNRLKKQEKAAAVILLSHNGLALDLKLASRIAGLDAILGGHTHDALPKPLWVNNPDGRTCVTNAGSHGKFLGALDLDIQNNKLRNLRYRLLPVFANLLEPDSGMQNLIDKLRRPYLDKLRQKLGVADKLLYRRDTYIGSFDQLLLNALLIYHDAQIAFSPGFRWGTTLLPRQIMTYEDIMNHTAITYPNTQRRSLSGTEIKAILEDAADNVFNKDPYYQQGGDMVRAGGLSFRCNPNAEMGQRISAIRLTNGELLQPDKDYATASWASVSGQADDKPMSEVATEYMQLFT